MKKEHQGQASPGGGPTPTHRPWSSDVTSWTLVFLGREMGMTAMEGTARVHQSGSPLLPEHNA